MMRLNELPIMISDIFRQDDDSDIEDNINVDRSLSDTNQSNDQNGFIQQYEISKMKIVNISINIRQFSWHRVNANYVWPGTNMLAEYIDQHADKYSNQLILELGSATGALAIYLYLNNHSSRNFNVMTSDIDDNGEVQENISFNFHLNDLKPVNHIPFTWGNDWTETLNEYSKINSLSMDCFNFKYVIASDILLYVNSYPALVQTLVDMFRNPTLQEFLMCWNRRLSSSKLFFDLMENAEFTCENHGKSIYTFTRSI